VPSAIERTSFEIIARTVDLSRFGPLGREVAARIVHATADPLLVETLILPEHALERAIELINRRRPLIADVAMVKAGITSYPSKVAIARERKTESTRCAQGMKEALLETEPPFMVVIGSAPTALEKVLADSFEPAFVAAFPVGFVGAKEVKEKLASSSLEAITNLGPRGGSPIAASAFNALVYLARGERRLEK
jgi:precorrin-8X/cobalt-precorrin-8 methylmutase